MAPHTGPRRGRGPLLPIKHGGSCWLPPIVGTGWGPGEGTLPCSLANPQVLVEVKIGGDCNIWGGGESPHVQRIQRKGLSPPGVDGGAGGPLSGSKGCGKVLGSSGKVPACGKALAEAGRAAVAAGTLLRGIGRDAL